MQVNIIKNNIMGLIEVPENDLPPINQLDLKRTFPDGQLRTVFRVYITTEEVFYATSELNCDEVILYKMEILNRFNEDDYKDPSTE